MIIKSISAENFGKFDRYSVNLDDNINVFFGDNEAGKTTLYEIISILLFAPSTAEEIEESNKLIKSDEKYARVYAIINMDGKEISIAREIYVNDTNLSIADQDNVSSLGNVNVPFIGDLSKDMYESFHTIDYYNMATITKNVWEQIIKVIEDSRGGPRTTPDYSTPEDESVEIKKATFEEEIAAKEAEKSNLQKALKDAQKKQKRMIKNQDKIDDLISDLEDVENNIELESSYLKEANKMNQIRETIKKTQDLSLELEKYKNLKPWMPNLRAYYERLKLYSENKANGIENPLDMFDDLEEAKAKPKPKPEPKSTPLKVEAAEEPEKEADAAVEAETLEEISEVPAQAGDVKDDEMPAQDTVTEEVKPEAEIEAVEEAEAVEEKEMSAVEEETEEKITPMDIIEEVKAEMQESAAAKEKEMSAEEEPAAIEIEVNEEPEVEEEKPAEVKKIDIKSKLPSLRPEEVKEEKAEAVEEVKKAEEPDAAEETQSATEDAEPEQSDAEEKKLDLSDDREEDASKDKINTFIEESYLNGDSENSDNEEDSYADEQDQEEMLNTATSRFIAANLAEIEEASDDLETEEVDEDETEEQPQDTVGAVLSAASKIQEMKAKKAGKIPAGPVVQPEAELEPEPETEDEPEAEIEVKPLEIRKPDDIDISDEELEERGNMNSFGQINPYSDNIFPDMDKVNYFGNDLSKLKANLDDEEEDDKYSTSTSNDLPTQTQKVAEEDMNDAGTEKTEEEQLLEAEEFLNKVNMQEVISASKEVVKIDPETQEEIDKAQLRYKVIAKRVFNQDMDMDDLSQKLHALDTNAIYKSIVKYKGLSQRQRKMEHEVVEVKPKTQSSSNSSTIALGVVAALALLLGLSCFFIDQIIAQFPNVNALNVIYQVIMELPLNEMIAGNLLAGGAFTLIAVLLTVAIVLGSEKPAATEMISVDEVELDELKNSIRMAKREVIDSLKDFPIPSSYLDNPNNTIITVINELREAEGAYKELIEESTMPHNPNYRQLWKLTKKLLKPNELGDDLFDNISRLRRKIQDSKAAAAEKEAKLKEAKMRINMIAGTPSFSPNSSGGEAQRASSSFNSFPSSMSTSSIPSTEPKEPQQTAANPVQESTPSMGSSFGIPRANTQSEPTEEVQAAKNASAGMSFGLPTSSQSSMPNTEVPASGQNDISFKMPTETESAAKPESDIKFKPSSKASDITFKPSSEQGDASQSPMYNPTEGNAYPSDSGMYNTEKDMSYPESAGTFGAVADTSYPSFGGDDENKTVSSFGESETSEHPSMGMQTDNPFGAAQTSTDNPFGGTQTSDDNPFNTPKDTSYPESGGMFGAATTESKDNPFDSTPQPEPNHAMGSEQKNDDFGIPGIRRYTGTEQTENSNPFAAQTTEKKTYDISSQDSDSASDDPFNIPGIKRYTNDSVQPETENKSNIDFVTPKESPSQPESGADDNPYGIPGIKRYTYEEPEKQPEKIVDAEPVKTEIEEKAEETVTVFQSQEPKEEAPKMGGLPGLDKFSNRGQQANKPKVEPKMDVIDEEVPIVPPTAPQAETVAAAATAAVGAGAGAFALSGLPGLDKFSNRGEAAAKKKAEQEAAKQAEESVKDEVSEQPMEADPFSIPSLNKVEEKVQEEITEPAEEKAEPVEEAQVEQAKDVEEKPDIEEEKAETIEEEQTEDEPLEEESVVEEIKKPVVKDRREKELDKMLEILGDDPESTIRDIEDMARTLHREIVKRDSAMGDLLKLNDAAVRLSTLSSSKWPYKQKAIDASRERIDYLEADKLKMQRHLEMLESKINEVPYEETPQAIADRIKEIDEEIEQLKLESDKHALAEELIEKQKLLDMSSSEDRSHIIDDTSIYMKELTLGKYVEVKINDEQTGLSICDKDGQWFDTTKDRLSQATREQLYLALRISIADLFDEKSLIFPMFFDEALITWDKRRMKAVMRLLSKMSMHRQVIIFTCHDWLKDMISEYLIGAKIILM